MKRILSIVLVFMLTITGTIIFNNNLGYAIDSSKIEKIESDEFKKNAGKRLKYKSISFNKEESKGVIYAEDDKVTYPDPNSKDRPIKIVMDAVVKYSDTEDVNVKLTTVLKSAIGKDDFDITGNGNRLVSLDSDAQLKDLKPHFEPANNNQLIYETKIEGLGKIYPFHSDTDVNWKWAKYFLQPDEKPYFTKEERRAEGIDFGLNNPIIDKIYMSKESKLVVSDDNSKFYAPQDDNWDADREDANLYGLIVKTNKSSLDYKIVVPLGAYSELDFVRADILPKELKTRWVEQGNESHKFKEELKGKEFGESVPSFTVKEDGKDVVYELVNTVISEDGNIKTYEYLRKALPLIPAQKKVITKWIDEKGKELKDSVTDKTTKEAGTIEGYTFVHTKTDEKGNVTHIFKKVVVEKEYTTKWVDEKGKELKDSVTDKTTKEAGTIEGYTFVDTKTDKKGNVTHIFKKVVVEKEYTTNWVDENGKPLKDPITDKTTKEAGTIEGYTFVKTTTDEKGNVTHIFKKVVVVVEKEYTTNWVDENGKPLKDPVTDKTTKESGTIEGYTFVDTKTDEKGNVTHIFKKVVVVVEKEYTTNWVDEKGKVLKEPVTAKSIQPRGEIKGYVYVGKNTDKNGNVTYIFKIFNKKQELPKTGSSSNTIVYGMLMILLGFSLVRKRA